MSTITSNLYKYFYACLWVWVLEQIICITLHREISLFHEHTEFLPPFHGFLVYVIMLSVVQQTCTVVPNSNTHMVILKLYKFREQYTLFLFSVCILKCWSCYHVSVGDAQVVQRSTSCRMPIGCRMIPPSKR